MERLLGRKVHSDILGEGTIIDAAETTNGIIITVEYSEPKTTKRYGFPTVLGKSIDYDDDLQHIADDIARAKEEALKKAEEERQVEDEAKLRQESDKILEQAKPIISGTARDGVFTSEKFNIYKVHQGKSYPLEFKGGYVWAPDDGIHYHERLKNIKPGDIIFHYADGNLVAIGEAVSGCFSYPNPYGLSISGWGHRGFRVEVRYQELQAPYSLTPHIPDIIKHRAPVYSSFDVNGKACLGYMYELEYTLAKLFKAGILALPQPAGVIRVLGRIV